MNAWIGCLTYADDDEAGMSAPANMAGKGDVLILQFADAADFASRCPEQYAASSVGR